MRRPILTALVVCACVAGSHDTGRAVQARGAVVAQDTMAPFTGTLEPVRRPPRRSLTPGRPAVLEAVRVGPQGGYDRVTFEFSGPDIPGYSVAYDTLPIRACGSGNEVSLAGANRLVVRLEPAQAHDTLGHVTSAARALTPRLAQVQDLKLVCDFEGQVEWAVGLAAMRRYRVLEATQPARLILDVRHRD